jgi:hypothetical protein
MEELSPATLDQAKNGEFSAFAATVKKVLDQKVKAHPYIKDKKSEMEGYARIKDIFAQIDSAKKPEEKQEPVKPETKKEDIASIDAE